MDLATFDARLMLQFGGESQVVRSGSIGSKRDQRSGQAVAPFPLWSRL